MPQVWAHRVIIPPVDRVGDPFDAARATANFVLAQVPARLTAPLMQRADNPITALLQGTTLDVINNAMVGLYDWADQNDVWIEFVELEDLVKAGYLTAK